MKHTKIVATIGPATENLKILEALANAGMDVARLNFSHGSKEEHQKRLDLIREISAKINKPIAILEDLSGPKIRISDFYKESIMLKNGKNFILTTKKCIGDENRVFVNYKNLHREIKMGSTIFLNDGRNELRVKKISGNDIHCRIVVGGEIRGRRGVNLPDSHLKISSLTAKDKKDIDFGVKNKVDFMAISFVRTPGDIIELRKILKSKKADGIKIIAKIETQMAVENLDSIIEISDGIMVARGDLAPEVGAEQVPVLQKMIIKKCNIAGKPVITATQMMESMIKNSVPTRAEVNDVANAIFDGSDAVMLSEETTLGDYPIEAVEAMARIAESVEENFNYEGILKNINLAQKLVTDSVSYSVVNIAYNVGAKVIVALTESGRTARAISRCKPKQPILVLTPNKRILNQLSLSFGCFPYLIGGLKDIDGVIDMAKKIAIRNGFVKKGDKMIISAGIPFGRSGSTNLILAQEV